MKLHLTWLMFLSLLTIAFPHNRAVSHHPFAIMRSGFNIARSSLAPLSGPGLENQTSRSYPGLLRLVFMPAQSESLDLSPPFVMALTPKNGSITRESNPAISAIAMDNRGLAQNSVKLVLNGDTLTNTAATWKGDTLSFSLDDPMGEGFHRIEVVAYDSAGNMGNAQWGFTIDSRADSVQIIKSPYARLSTDEYPVYGKAGPGDSVFVYLNGSPLASCRADTTTGAYEFGRLQLSQGNIEIVIFSVDAAGNQSPSDTTQLLVDSRKPLYTLNASKNRLRGDTLQTGMPAFVFHFVDSTSGLDTGSMLLIFQGDTVDFDSITTVVSAGKTRLDNSALLREVFGHFAPPLIPNHTRVSMLASIRDNNTNPLSVSLSLYAHRSDSIPPDLVFPHPGKDSVADYGEDFVISCRAEDRESDLLRISLHRISAGLDSSGYARTQNDTVFFASTRAGSLRLNVDWKSDPSGQVPGLTYRIMAMDEFGNLCSSGVMGIHTRHENLKQRKFTPGKWHMFSVPFASSNAMDSIVDRFGEPDPSKWRWARYRDTVLTEYDNSGFDGIAPGRAFWFHHRSLSTWALPTGRATTVPVTDTIKIPLLPGWNQIGTPLFTELPWRQIRFSGPDSLVSLPFGYDPETGDYLRMDPDEMRVVLQPWMGYWIHNQSPDTMEMRILPAFSVPAGKISPKPEKGWRTPVTFAATGQITRCRIGEYASCTDATDRKDALLPPSPAAGLRSMLHARDGTPLSECYKRFQEENEGREFLLSVRLPEEIEKLAVETAPTHYPFSVLWDPLLCKPYDLSDSARHFLELVKGVARPQFKLWTGSREYIRKKLKEASFGIPRKWALRSFPNPFNPVLRIQYDIPAGPPGRQLDLRIYSVSGARIKTLARKQALPGRHAVNWNGRDHAGRTIATGVYFLRLECSGTQKMVFNRKLVLAK